VSVPYEDCKDVPVGLAEESRRGPK